MSDGTQGGCGLACITYIASSTTGSSIKTPPEPEDENADLPFDATLGGNNNSTSYEATVAEEDARPSVFALISLGIPLNIAILSAELALTFAEVQILLATLAQPELAPVTVPMELFLGGASLALMDFEVAYWSYVYRVAYSPEGETVAFEYLPPWGFREGSRE